MNNKKIKEKTLKEFKIKKISDKYGYGVYNSTYDYCYCKCENKANAEKVRGELAISLALKEKDDEIDDLEKQIVILTKNIFNRDAEIKKAIGKVEKNCDSGHDFSEGYERFAEGYEIGWESALEELKQKLGVK